ncbi:MAG: hypothetical protein HXX09_09290 [Bacteroidetes bacterium]|nr:hypothetical protein [Bacteroidota bacterium]
MPFFNFIYSFFGNFKWIIVITAFGLLFFQTIILNNLATDHELPSKNTYLPALVYIVLMSSSVNAFPIHPVLFSNFFLLLALNIIFELYGKSESFVDILNISLLISLASLFYFPCIFFLLLFWIAFIIYRMFSLREWIISIVGIILPYFFLAIYYFWNDKLLNRIQDYQKLLINLKHFSLKISTYQIVLYSVIGAILLIAFYSLMTRTRDKAIKNRKFNSIIFWFLILGIVSIALSSNYSSFHFGIAFIPASILISNYFVQVKRKWFAEVLFLILLGVVIYGTFF